MFSADSDAWELRQEGRVTRVLALSCAAAAAAAGTNGIPHGFAPADFVL